VCDVAIAPPGPVAEISPSTRLRRPGRLDLANGFEAVEPEDDSDQNEIIPTTMTNGAIGMHRNHSMDACLPI